MMNEEIKGRTQWFVSERCVWSRSITSHWKGSWYRLLMQKQHRV